MKKKCSPEILVKTVMSVYEGAETKVRFGSGLSEEFSVKVGVHQGSVLSSLLFGMVIYEVTENARKGWMKQIVVVVVVAHFYPPVTGQRQTLTYWTISTLSFTTTTS